jgi:membrane protease YdiL (CAAX protease family)
MLLPLLVCAAIAVSALAVPQIIGRSTFWIFLPGFFTETILLLCSLALAAWLTRGRLAAFGLTRGSFRFTPGFLLWLLPMSIIATLQVIGPPAGTSGGPAPGPIGSPVAIVLSIWIYASLCEEIFTRGLLQSWLSPLARHRIRLGRWALSVPVLTSALFFGAMHVVLWPKLGPAALVVMCLAAILGLIAGQYREKTGSLLPAILIHAFFDIGGTLPPWIAAWLHRGPV